MIYGVKVLSAWSTLLKWLSLSTLLALEVMTPQKRKTKAILLWWMVSLTCLISPLSIVHISEQGPYDIYTIRLKAIERAPLIYLKELQFSISESRPKANEFWNFWFFSYYSCHFYFHKAPISIDCQWDLDRNAHTVTYWVVQDYYYKSYSWRYTCGAMFMPHFWQKYGGFSVQQGVIRGLFGESSLDK